MSVLGAAQADRDDGRRWQEPMTAGGTDWRPVQYLRGNPGRLFISEFCFSQIVTLRFRPQRVATLQLGEPSVALKAGPNERIEAPVPRLFLISEGCF